MPYKKGIKSFILATLLMTLLASQVQASTVKETSESAGKVQAEAWLASQAASLKAEGFTLAVVHAHEMVANSPRWYRSSTGRYYYFKLQLGINHEYDNPPGVADRWRPYFNVTCRREYPQDNQDVVNACNIYVDKFRAVRFKSAEGLSIEVLGTANPSNETCRTTTNVTPGTYRNADINWPWVAAELNEIKVDFLVDLTNCTFLHASNLYQSRSYRTNVCGCANGGDIDYEESSRDDKFGLWPI